MAQTNCRKAAFAAAIALATAPLSAITQAAAEDWPDHDRRIEQWAAQKISAKLGDLRGTFGHEMDLASATVHESFDQPKPLKKPSSRIFVLPKKPGEALPPLVSNEAVPRGVDPVLTGSTRALPPGVDPIVTGTAKTLPPGVDPIVTGSNAQPTGAAHDNDRNRGWNSGQDGDWFRPLSTSMLWQR